MVRDALFDGDSLKFLLFLLRRLKKGDDRGSQCAKKCMECCMCCFWFLEKFLRYLNHNAYTVIGKSPVRISPEKQLIERFYVFSNRKHQFLSGRRCSKYQSIIHCLNSTSSRLTEFSSKTGMERTDGEQFASGHNQRCRRFYFILGKIGRRNSLRSNQHSIAPPSRGRPLLYDTVSVYWSVRFSDRPCHTLLVRGKRHAN